MTNHITTHVGLDVHKHSSAIVVAAEGERARFIGTVGPELNELIRALDKLGSPATMQIVYEAGPCGYGLVRSLRSRGYQCEVIAPAKVARRAGDRVKTDRRDALHLSEQSRAGALTAVWVLDAADEAIRDLSRAREDAVRARLKARQRLQAMLLRPRPPLRWQDGVDGGARALSGAAVFSVSGTGTRLRRVPASGE